MDQAKLFVGKLNVLRSNNSDLGGCFDNSTVGAPNVPITIAETFAGLFHNLCISVVKFLYFIIFPIFYSAGLLPYSHIY